MSKVKDILGLVVRSITKRILGTNVPPMLKADGTLLYHLKRIKRGVDGAYQSLRRRAYNIEVGGVDNLSYAIDNMLTSVITINGDERISTLGDLMFRDTTKVTEIVDNITDFKVNNSGSRSNNYNYIAKAFPNLKKISFTKKSKSVGYTYRGTDGLLMPSNIAEEIVCGIVSFGNLNWANFISNDSKLVKLSFPNLTGSNNIYGVHINNCSKLKEIDAPLLTEGSYGFSIAGCSELEELYLPNHSMMHYNGNCLSNCAKLRILRLPNLTHAGSIASDNPVIKNCPALEEITFGVLSNIGRSSQFSDVALNNLYKFEVGDGTKAMASLSKWTANNVEDELLNNNFKTYFAERLVTWTNGSVHTLTFCQSFYDRLTEENKTILANKGWTIAIAE